ncbi:MAG: cobyric acid synthase, partial [Alphaproteobacteria bacterium]|nr:cobyric acid synthase [Alphaproteobacteria bacterium]
MIQGTGSDVGKSLIVAGLCRAFTRQGLRVRPFKPQNMSNNAAVADDGGEIGRAQALQARACGVPATVEMNPVLLKPQAAHSAQIVLGGKVLRAASAREYRALAPSLLPAVLDAFARVSAEADLVLVEGAGSPAEVNLRAGDIANMGFAEAADVPVALVGDIDRGGVIAQLVGTHALLSPAERARLAGFIVNKFRGDPQLFDDGVTAIGQRTGWPCFGVVPWFPEAHLLPAEDSMALSAPHRSQASGAGSFPLAHAGEGGSRRLRRRATGGGSRIKIAVPVLPHIANFDDLDPLRAEPGAELVMLRSGQPLPADTRLVILPGSKATLADLAALRGEGWDIDILAHRRRGGHVLGICGGYQMLGRTVADPGGVEGTAGSTVGLGLLEVDTVLGAAKRLAAAAGVEIAGGAPVRGYEMHLGITTGAGAERPMLRLGDRTDGAVSADGRVAGCYLHGLFASDAFRRALLARLGAGAGPFAYESLIDDTLDRLAEHLAAS